MLLENLRPGGGRETFDINEILYGIRYALQWALVVAFLKGPVCGLCPVQCSFGAQESVSIQLIFQTVDARNKMLGQFNAGYFTFPDESGQLCDGLVVQGRNRHDLSSFYSGCQKNVPVFKRFFLQTLMPQYRHSEHYYGKRYNMQDTYNSLLL
jgi:hypothetical protein